MTSFGNFTDGVGNAATRVSDNIAPYINAAIALLQLWTQKSYIQNKMELCTWDIGKKKPPLAFGFDIVFDFGPIIGQKGIKNLCSLYSSRRRGLSSDEERRRLAALMISYPIIPAISLPCIPIFPPALMLCPAIDVSTKFGLDIDPELSATSIEVDVVPFVSFDITASMSLTLGIPILNAQVVMGVSVSFVVIEFSFSLGIDIENFGIYGDIGIDIKVLQLNIYLQFQVCAGAWIFQACWSTTLWSTDLVAWTFQQKFAEFGSGSSSTKSALPSNADEATTVLRFYWAFKDSSTEYNGDYDYQWSEEHFTNFTDFDFWA
eukprot:732442_1